MIGRFISMILCVEAIFMIPALLISIFENETAAVKGFSSAIFITAIIAAILYLICCKAKHKFYAREGLVCVGIGWTVMSLLGALPFFLSREIPKFIDAFFEIVSGFTTTGSSVVADVEALSHGILYWRSFSHWVGGMGILVFVLAIAPTVSDSGGFAMHLMRAESPGPDVGKLVPRMKKTAATLYVMYIALTVLNFIFLFAGHMPLFDSVCTAFGTAGTGGFGIKNDSMAGYSPYLQNVTTIFMLLFGINFSCYHFIFIKQFASFFKNEELRFYLGIYAASVTMIVINLQKFYATFGETLRHAAFQVSSIITTSGFSTTDFDKWPTFSKTILLFLMAIGACAGSTGGGMKCIRLLLLIKNLRRGVHRAVHPQRVQPVRCNGVSVNEKILDNINIYTSAYILMIALSMLLVSIDGFSITTNLSAVVSCFNNIGPGLDKVGPLCNFGSYSTFSKLVLSFDMLAGRLEIFPILILFSPSTWKRK